jgi:hypothetical protein
MTTIQIPPRRLRRPSGNSGWKAAFVGLWEAIDLRGLVALWVCAMVATVVLVTTDAPSIVAGVTFGCVAVLAFWIVPRWERLAIPFSGPVRGRRGSLGVDGGVRELSDLLRADRAFTREVQASLQRLAAAVRDVEARRERLERDVARRCSEAPPVARATTAPPEPAAAAAPPEAVEDEREASGRAGPRRSRGGRSR